MAVIALVAAFVTVLGSRIVVPGTASAGASAPPTATIYQVPTTIADDCSIDVTGQLQNWLGSLPNGQYAATYGTSGTAPAPIIVMFQPNGCYLVNSSIELLAWQNVTFDGNGSTLEQHDITTSNYAFTNPLQEYCDNSQAFGNTGINYNNTTAIMWWVEGGCNLTWRNFTFAGSWAGPGSASPLVQRTVTDAAWGAGTTLTSATANFTSADLGRQLVGANVQPAGTYITAVISPTQVGVSQSLTGSRAGQTVSLGYSNADSIPEQDSIFQLNGTQQATITNSTITNPWGDWVTIFGIHDGNPNIDGPNGYGGAAGFPSTDVTISYDTTNGSGRQGITPIYVNRADVEHNSFGAIRFTEVDVEADADGGCTCDVNVSNNSFINGRYGYLVSAQTGTDVERFAFDNNTTVGPLKIAFKAGANTQNLTFANDVAQEGWLWANGAINIFPNSTTNGLDVYGNTTPAHDDTYNGPQAFVETQGSTATNVQVHNNTITGGSNGVQNALDNGPGIACDNTIDGVQVGYSPYCVFSVLSQPAAVHPPADYPSTTVVLPADAAAFGGTQNLVATTSDAAAVNSVKFEVTGVGLSDYVVGQATSTNGSWGFQWNTKTVQVLDGSYFLQSVACNAAGNCSTSYPIGITVDNTPPTSGVTQPAGGAIFGGTEILVANASGTTSGVASVGFEITGAGLSHYVVGQASLVWGVYAFQWNTETPEVPDGTYALSSVACDKAGNCANSTPVTITVYNGVPTVSILDPPNLSVISGQLYNLVATASTSVPNVPVTSVQFFISDQFLNNGATTPIGNGTLAEIFGVQIWFEQIDSRYLPSTYVSVITAVATDSQGHVGSAQVLAGVDN